MRMKGVEGEGEEGVGLTKKIQGKDIGVDIIFSLY